jgi:hypothetical protein
MNSCLAHAGVALALFVIAPAGALAGTVIDGSGGKSCGAWIEDEKADRNSAIHSMDVGWVIGFLSGANLGTNVETLKNRDVDSFKVRIDNYCSLHPLDSIGEATIRLSVELIDQARGSPK